MPTTKPNLSSMMDTVRTDEGSDSIDSFIRQALGKDPMLSLSRATDNPVQWIQLLHALDQQDLPGWPLLTPVKVQMQKCEKCSREFCSSINYRRHIRLHRRSFNTDKDATVNRDLLGAFWDKLSFDEAKEAVSLNNISLEEVPGSSILKALASFIRKPGFSLPHVYVKAGSALLDVVQARASRFPIPSQELFSILDDASERTFLCGTAVSVQKYIFDGDAGKIGLEMKNLVACTSFLVEQILVKAWVADKDAEALRCQKLLVEEEEAAQKRKADLLEKKRQKKLRQKEQKAKDQSNEKAELKDRLDADSLEESAVETSTSQASNTDSHSPASPDSAPKSFEPIQHNKDKDTDLKVQPEQHQPLHGQVLGAQKQMTRSRRVTVDGFHRAQNAHISRHGVQRYGAYKEPRGALVVTGKKVWAQKPKLEHESVLFKNRKQKEVARKQDKSKKHELLIGSIPVELGTSCSLQRDNGSAELQDACAADKKSLKKIGVHERASKPDVVQSGVNRSVKLWRAVSRPESRGSEQCGQGGSDVDTPTAKANARNLSRESCLESCAMDESCSGSDRNSVSPMEEGAGSRGQLFSVRAAEAFLAKRWKEAIASDHVQLVITSESEPPGCPEVKIYQEADTRSSPERKILCSAENRQPSVMASEPPAVGIAKSRRLNPKVEKGVKLKYIPKQSGA